MKKTPEQAAEEYSQLYKYINDHAIGFDPRLDIREIICLRRGKKEGFLAGRKHFIEHELRGYLEMAAVLGVEKRLIDPGIAEIINKARKD